MRSDAPRPDQRLPRPPAEQGSRHADRQGSQEPDRVAARQQQTRDDPDDQTNQDDLKDR